MQGAQLPEGGQTLSEHLVQQIELVRCMAELSYRKSCAVFYPEDLQEHDKLLQHT